MKKIIFLKAFFLVLLKIQAQSSTIASNYVVIPGVPVLPVCANTDKGKTVFNTTDNKMYFCDGTAWQGMAGVPSAGVGWSQIGADITNTNTGIMKVNSATNKATNAIFGSNGTGISLQKSYPTIGFNQYRDVNNVQRYIGDGYAMGLFVAPQNGNMYWNANPLGIAGNLTPSETPLMTLSNKGNFGVNTLNPKKKFEVNGAMRITGAHHESIFTIYENWFILNSGYKYQMPIDLTNIINIKIDVPNTSCSSFKPYDILLPPKDKIFVTQEETEFYDYTGQVLTFFLSEATLNAGGDALIRIWETTLTNQYSKQVAEFLYKGSCGFISNGSKFPFANIIYDGNSWIPIERN
jgi:hypothetical protein